MCLLVAAIAFLTEEAGLTDITKTSVGFSVQIQMALFMTPNPCALD